MLPRLAAVAFAAMALLGAAVTWAVHGTEARGRQAAFDRVLVEAARLVETRVEQHLALLTATRAFLEAQQAPPERADFADFVRGLGLEGPYSGLQGLGLARIVAPGEEQAVRAALSAGYGIERGIWPEAADGLRTAIVLLEPADARNQAALGYDMASELQRRDAMLRALATGEAAATAPVTLVQEITEERQTGLLVFIPLRQAAVAGFAYAPVRMGDLFTAALAGRDLPIELRAVDDAAPAQPLFETEGFAAAQQEGRRTSEARLSVAGRDWTLAARPAAGSSDGWPRATLLSGVVFALLALATGFAVHWQATAMRRERALADAVRRSVEQKDFLLREMAHRLKNALARVSAIARQSAREAATKEELVDSLGARLRAMAAAQDLLVRSGTESADLADLLRSELGQISGEAAGPWQIAGPPVRLDPARTHALGLVFHELATNALKYGAGAQEGGELRIGWSTEPDGRELRLTWEERMPAPPPPAEGGAGAGFGTRLVDTIVTRELGGRLERRREAQGLAVALRIPLG